MTLFSISGLLIVATCIFLFLVTLFYRKNRLHNIWALMNLAVAIWGIGSFMVGKVTSEHAAFLSWRIGFFGAWFISLLFYHTIYVLDHTNKKIELIIVYLVGTLFVTLTIATNLIFTNWQVLFGGIYYNQATLWYYIALFAWTAVTFFAFCKLFKFLKKASGLKRTQGLYLFYGSMLGFSGGVLSLLPAMGIYIYPYTNFTVPIYTVVITYAIFRHQLLDIEVIIKKTLIFTSLFVSIYAVFAFFAFLGQMFFERFITQNHWVSIIPSVLIVTIMLRPLENFLVAVTDKYLFQKKYDYKHLLRIFTSEVLTVLEPDKLIKLTEEKLAEIMKLEYCKMAISDNVDIRMEAVLKIPISINDKLVGMLLLGKKKSDEEYTKDDMDILQSLSKTLAIAISNANLVDELTKAQVKMAEKDKMATIGTLAAGMAHEIRNPITTIRVFSEYVPDRFNDTEFTKKYKNTVAKEVDKIDHIIQTLIDFSGEEDIQQVSGVSAYEAVEELVSIISKDKDILGRIQFINNIPPDIAKVSVNKEELDEITLNLTQNAIHAISGNGMITFNAEEKDESVIIEISDTGSGMSEETIAHIFDPFFTTRSKGFGLGLFVVKELVQRNKGEISVESRMSEGAKFKIKFNVNDHR